MGSGRQENKERKMIGGRRKEIRYGIIRMRGVVLITIRGV